MTLAVFVLLFVYAALKVGKLAVSSSSGFDRTPLSLGQRLRSGEPLLFVAAILLSVPTSLAASWYHKHKFTEVRHTSTACYGRIVAFKDVPAIARTYKERAIYDAFERHRGAALDAARQVGENPVAAQRALDAEAAAFDAGQGAGRNGRLWQEQMSATRRCMEPPREDPNA